MSPYTALAAMALTRYLDGHPEGLSVVLWSVKAYLLGRGLDEDEIGAYVAGLLRYTELPE